MQNMQLKVQSNLPEKKFRAGAITATIWKNQTKNSEGHLVTYRTVTFGKNYKDKEGRWKTSNTLKTNDIPKATLVLNKAYEYMALTEGEDTDPEVK